MEDLPPTALGAAKHCSTLAFKKEKKKKVIFFGGKKVFSVFSEFLGQAALCHVFYD